MNSKLQVLHFIHNLQISLIHKELSSRIFYPTYIFVVLICIGIGVWMIELKTVHHESSTQTTPHTLSAMQSQLDDLGIRLAKLSTRITRLDELGASLSSQLPSNEFQFNSLPATGGTESTLKPYSLPEIQRLVEQLDGYTTEQEEKYDLLETRIADKSPFAIVGRPVEEGYLSSYYGYRTDPFTGKRDFHRGIDFAGPKGSGVLAVADGTVTKIKNYPGYGLTIEIKHGNDLITRYAHCQKIVVEVGDKVTSGQRIAEMGSSGRSTGPHVHFELLRKGKHVDPTKLIHAALKHQKAR